MAAKVHAAAGKYQRKQLETRERFICVFLFQFHGIILPARHMLPCITIAVTIVNLDIHFTLK